MLEYERLSLPDVLRIRPKVFGDSRGFFVTCYQKSLFEEIGVACDFVQDNMSNSERGVLRGLHYQKKPFAQAKLVRPLIGVIFDVALDVRKDSPTFGQHVALLLDAEKGDMMFIPEGFAHGFCTVSDYAYVYYKVNREYAPQAEGGIRFDDPDVAVDWPDMAYSLSDKDIRQPSFSEYKLRPEF